MFATLSVNLADTFHHPLPLLWRSSSSSWPRQDCAAAWLLLGTAAAWGLYAIYAPPGVGFTAFALIQGIAMSITAFPVLARILTERGLISTPVGNTAMASAAVDDVTA